MPIQLVRHNIFLIASGLFLAAVGIYGLLQFWPPLNQKASLSGILTATVSSNPLAVEIFVPEDAVVTKPFSIKARITNLGERMVEDATAEIFLPADLKLVGHDSVKELGRIGPQNSKNISWQIKASSQGSYVVSVSALGLIDGEQARKDSSAIVVVGARVKSVNNIAEFLAFLKTILAELIGLPN